jgi:hypothetical protein
VDADTEAATAGADEEAPVEITAKPGTAPWFVQAFAAFRGGNIDPIVQNFATDITWEAVGSPLAPISEGKQAVLDRWDGLLTGIPDMKLAAERVFARDALVVAQVVLVGTHDGEFHGLAPTGKRVGTRVLAWVWHDKEGKAKKVRIVYDEGSLLAQMGIIPGGDVPPVPELPTAEPEIVEADTNAEAVKVAGAWIKSWGAGAWKACQEKLCAENMVAHDTARDKTMSTPEEHEAATKAFSAAFPDMKGKSVDVVAFGDWVVVHGLLQGTHKGDLGPLAATKKKVKLDHSAVMRLEDTKIAEMWGYSNHLQLLAQIGAFELPKPAAE